MDPTNEDVQEILRALDSSPYDELMFQTEEFRLKLTRGTGGIWLQECETLSEPSLIGKGAEGLEPERAAEIAVEAAHILTADGLVSVHPPLPGTFYRAPKPGAVPFVEVGAQVNEDTVIGIIETMKLMNSAHAGATGEIVEICAANGEFVETDRVLMRLRPE